MSYDVLKTEEFEEWLHELKPKTRTQVLARLDLLSLGHFGNVYSFLWGSAIIVALYGGNKHAQDRDIRKAKKIRDEVLEGSRALRK